jgi:hypothetical protein
VWLESDIFKRAEDDDDNWLIVAHRRGQFVSGFLGRTRFLKNIFYRGRKQQYRISRPAGAVPWSPFSRTIRRQRNSLSGTPCGRLSHPQVASLP